MKSEKKSKNKKNITLTVFAGISVEKDGFWAAVRDGKKYCKEEKIFSSGKNINQDVFRWLDNFSAKNPVKIFGAGITGGENLNELTSRIWLKQDVVPFVFRLDGRRGRKRAIATALEVAKRFGTDEIIDIKYDSHRRVRTVRLAGLDDYKKVSGNGDFPLLIELSKKFKDQKGSMAFFSSTPRGGGVALMRHSLIRIFRLLGLDINWYVMNSKKTVFEITKKKFHNILQGVAPPNVRLNDADKMLISSWTEKNSEKFHDIMKQSKVIVIDDPQPSGMIAFIKKINPTAKIIYRSHIQIESNLIRNKKNSQREVWNFLWKNIKKADLFVSHPVKEFIPYNVPRKKTVLMPASTDDLDGLNKELSREQLNYYMDLFDRELEKSGQIKLDRRRPFIIQIARFDPSKGIPDVIESFRKLRKLMFKEGRKKGELPQLVIAGNGSVDDPEATSIHTGVMNILKMDTFKHYINDIKVVRLPCNDQILNTLLREAYVALQLSHREGFEIKITEALEKGCPVIAYNTGGIPLQIENGVTGFLVKIGNTSQVARHLHTLFTDKKKYLKMISDARKRVNKDYFSINSATKWLFLATELMEKGKFIGNRKSVREIIDRHYADSK